ncbi:MAG: hypothetical protein KGZ83_01295 [Sulfuricella sp.]|nr:hypothetical protein [Sulfuricella sp.]
MHKLIVAALLGLFVAGNALAADATCTDKAAEKKLAGAAKTSFMKKCEAGAKSSEPAASECAAQAAEKKLAGAAKNSFMKKCEAGATVSK